MSDGGKGSAPRPFSVSQEKFANNFDAIFRKNIKAAEEIHSDKGYELGTKEAYEEFAKKRQESLDKLHTANEELGLYDDEYDAIHKYNEETQEAKFRQLNK
jgi:predicted lipid-binding transport protein (Tim44 family)